jgi:hypothetical protein
MPVGRDQQRPGGATRLAKAIPFDPRSHAFDRSMRTRGGGCLNDGPAWLPNRGPQTARSREALSDRFQGESHGVNADVVSLMQESIGRRQPFLESRPRRNWNKERTGSERADLVGQAKFPSRLEEGSVQCRSSREHILLQDSNVLASPTPHFVIAMIASRHRTSGDTDEQDRQPSGEKHPGRECHEAACPTITLSAAARKRRPLQRACGLTVPLWAARVTGTWRGFSCHHPVRLGGPARAAHGSLVSLLALGLVACGGAPSRGFGAAPAQTRVDAAEGSLSDHPGARLGLQGPETAGPNEVGTTCECPSSADVNGSGYGRGGGGRIPRSAITANPAESRGGLDRAIVRRGVRRHLHELFACYPAAARDRDVGGLLTFDFTVGASGDVRAAALRNSTLGRNDQIASCFLEALRSWTFPRPRHGEEAVVVQRFILVPRPGPVPAGPRGGRR